MALPFPTGHTRRNNSSRVGHPLRAQGANLCHCAKRQRMLDEDESCARCGRYPEEVVARTWSELARSEHALSGGAKAVRCTSR